MIEETLKKYGFGKEAYWDCHGTPVIYHRVLEKIAVKAEIKFQAPHIVEAATKDKCAVICVTGEMGDHMEWSIGESAPYNYNVNGKLKTEYPWAMAEKRAKDRVILKLIGLHGFAYSEEEADEFKKQSDTPQEPKTWGTTSWTGPMTKTALKADLRGLGAEIPMCDSDDMLNPLLLSHTDALNQAEKDLPDWHERIGELVKKQRNTFND